MAVQLLASQERFFSMTLIVIHCKTLTFMMLRLYKAATVLSALMEEYSIPCHDRGHINVMLVLQSCTDPLEVMAASSTETFPTSSDGTYDIGNVKVEKEVDIEWEEEVNVKTEREEECIDIKDEEGIYSEEEEKEEDIYTQEEEDVEIKEEVSCEDTVQH